MSKPIILPYPDRRLSPNARLHHFELAKVKQLAHDIGFYAAKDAGIQCPDGALQLLIRVHPPDRRKRDDDNVLASLKAYRDGMFDALGVNDNMVRLSTHGFGEIVKGGAVYVWIEPLPVLPGWMSDVTTRET